MKTSFSVLILVTMLFASKITARAQQAKVYEFLSGGTTTMPGGVTNQFVVAGFTNQLGSPTADAITGSNLVQTVAEFDNAGITWQFKGSNLTTNGNMASLLGVTHLGFSIENHTPGYLTNVLFKINLKSPKYLARPAGQ
jgi:hypothetical protein